MKLSKFWNRIFAWLRQLFRFVVSMPFLGQVVAILWESGRKFSKDDCMVMAGSVAFSAMLSFIPFVLLLLTVAGYFFEYSGLTPERILEQLETGVRSAIPFVEGEVMERIRQIIAARRTYGLTGLIALLLTTGMLFRSLELALGRVFDAPRRRSVWRSQFLLLLLIAALGVFLLLLHFASVVLVRMLSAREVDFTATVDAFLQKHYLLRFVTNIVVASLAFTLLVRYLAQRRVRWRAVILGGLFFALLWLVAVRLFGYYLEHLARFDLIYGSLAALAIMVVWLYYTAVMLLFCAELSASLDRRLT